MRSVVGPGLAAAWFALLALPAAAQQSPPPPQPPQAAPVNSVAATVNGQPIYETAIQRGLDRVPPARRTEARGEIVEFLIDNTLLDQYLQQMQIAVAPKDVDGRIDQIKQEIAKQKQTYEKVLQELRLTEAELRTQITSDLRWDKFVLQQATEQNLRALFDGNKEMFDGSMVRARHILLTPRVGDAQAGEQAKAQLLAWRAQIEKQAADQLAKLPPQADKLSQEQARGKLVEDAFAALAKEKSACPSREKGGDVSWFFRAGSMVEPFAKAAFALKPYQMSDPVKTQFGYHLILCVETRAGKAVKFEDVKDEVREVYAERLRESVCARLRQTAKIAVNPPPRQ